MIVLVIGGRVKGDAVYRGCSREPLNCVINPKTEGEP